jgi:hypothetical protein
MSKILEFPKSKIVRDVPFDDEEINKTKEKNRQKYADELVEDIKSGLLAELESCGINIDHPAFLKDYIYLSDILKGTIYRNFGLEHQSHKFIDEYVKVATVPEGTTPEEIAEIIAQMIEETKANTESFVTEEETKG